MGLRKKNKKAEEDLENLKDETLDLSENTMTMHDDVADLLINKKKGGVLTSSFKKRNGDDIQRDLSQVYADDDGQIPDLTKLDKMQRPLWQTILYTITITLTILFIVAAGGFLVFSNLNDQTFTNEKVNFKIDAPLTVISGQEQTYKIIITNKERVNLYNLEVELIYPEGFEYISGEIESTGDKKNIWNISVLRIGETREIEFKARILLPVNSETSLSGTLTFKPENLNADFKQRAFLDLFVNSSVVSLVVNGPDKILANQKAEYKIELFNNNEEEINDLEILIEYPKEFIFGSSSLPAIENSNNSWLIASLLPRLSDEEDGDKEEQKYELIISGDYGLVIDDGNKEFLVKVFLRKSGQRILMAEQSIISKIIKDQLVASLIINSSGEDQAVNFGELLFYTLNYKNTGQEEIKNIEIKATLNSDVLSWQTLVDENNGLKKNNTITWTGKEVPKLLNLRPGEEGNLSWQIRVADLSNLDDSVNKFNVESEIELSGKLADGTTNEIKTKKIKNSINSDLNLDVIVRYYDENNLPLGSGSIIPKVGETSSYNLVFKLSNNIHDIGDLEISAVLPRNVSWDNKPNYNIGEINYDGTSQRITWKINSLSKNNNNVTASFNLSIKPQEDDFGRVLILLPEIKLSAKDLTTGSNINKTIRAITTSFNDPTLGRVSGIVE